MKYKNIYICSLCRAMARHEIPLEKKPASETHSLGTWRCKIHGKKVKAIREKVAA